MGSDRKRLTLNGHERIYLRGLRDELRPGGLIAVDVLRDDGTTVTFDAALDVLTEREVNILRAGGMLPMSSRHLLRRLRPPE